MKNLLAERLTAWRFWYALPAMLAVPLASGIMVLGGLFPPEAQSIATAILLPLQFVTFALLALGGIALLARRWPSRQDLALKPGLSGRDLVAIAAGFLLSHAFFWYLGRVAGPDPDQAARLFEETGLSGPFLPAVSGVVASVILAPVCEELLYRGAVLRPIHDALARRDAKWLGAAIGIVVSSALFALPHLGGSLSGWQAAAYLASGATFGLVYVLTGSMTAAMVSHSLQSMAAFGQILIFGRGDVAVSPIIWILVFGCPIWVYLCARGLHRLFPADGR